MATTTRRSCPFSIISSDCRAHKWKRLTYLTRNINAKQKKTVRLLQIKRRNKNWRFRRKRQNRIRPLWKGAFSLRLKPSSKRSRASPSWSKCRSFTRKMQIKRKPNNQTKRCDKYKKTVKRRRRRSTARKCNPTPATWSVRNWETGMRHSASTTSNRALLN